MKDSAKALSVGLPGWLAAAGVAPEAVDYVMCTHLHMDHVGWNTRLVDGRWVPTFPNARYLFGRREYHERNPATGGAASAGRAHVFADSVLPCVEAGLGTLIEDGFRVDDALVVESAPGHTAGNVIVRARSEGRTGLFTADCLHTPLQIAYPDVNSAACEHPVEARQTRRRLLAELAEHGHLLIPAHFPPPFYGRVAVWGDAFIYHPRYR